MKRRKPSIQPWSDQNFTLMRMAEILLIYAEAKIESNSIDATVLEAINRVRARAYGVDVTDTGNYPAITTTNQAELRKVIRRERKVELANEGFRLYDIRRWKHCRQGSAGGIVRTPSGLRQCYTGAGYR